MKAKGRCQTHYVLNRYHTDAVFRQMMIGYATKSSLKNRALRRKKGLCTHCDNPPTVRTILLDGQLMETRKLLQCRLHVARGFYARHQTEEKLPNSK